VPTNKPARLDWDFFNNCGYLHVNWIPAGAVSKRIEKSMANVDVILAQLRRIHTDRVRHYQRQAE